MSDQTDGHTKQERFMLGIWGKNMTRSMHSNPKMPGSGTKRGFKKSKHGKMRWYLIIGLSVIIVAITVVVISLAVHFATVGNDKDQLQQEQVETIHFGISGTEDPNRSRAPQPEPTQQTRTHLPHTTDTDPVSSKEISSPFVTSHTRIITTSRTSRTRTTTSLSTQDKGTTTGVEVVSNYTSARTIPSSIGTEKATTRTSSLSSVTSSTQFVQSTNEDSTSTSTTTSTGVRSSVTSSEPTILSISSSSVTTTYSNTKPSPDADRTTNINQESSTDFIDLDTITSTPISTLPPFLQPVISLKGNNIVLPFATSRVSFTCFAINVNNWMNLKIIRHYEYADSALVEVKAGIEYPSVFVVDANFTSEVSYKQDALMVTIKSDAVDCTYIGNYSCVLTTPESLFRNETEVRAVQTKPELSVSTSIIEGKNVTLQCSSEILGMNGSIKWKVRPPGLNKYFDLSLTPQTSKVYTNCSTKLTSYLSLTPQRHDNASYFRCEVKDEADENGVYLYTETQMLVVPKNFCNDKGTYSVHKHPYYPCNKVVYCFIDGPHVYEINCDPGKCYDKDTTRCIPMDSS